MGNSILQKILVDQLNAITNPATRQEVADILHTIMYRCLIDCAQDKEASEAKKAHQTEAIAKMLDCVDTFVVTQKHLKITKPVVYTTAPS